MLHQLQIQGGLTTILLFLRVLHFCLCCSTRLPTASTAFMPSSRSPILGSRRGRMCTDKIHKIPFRPPRVPERKLYNSNEIDESAQGKKQRLPKLVVFDLDGCLWRPEMYELLYLMGGNNNHSPFFKPKSSKVEGSASVKKLISSQGRVVQLLGNVQYVLNDLHTNPIFKDTRVGISSRTDQPDWARELLDKFTLSDNQSHITLSRVFDPELITLRQNSKTSHFAGFAEQTGLAYEDMMFFDNESGNCRQIAALGTTVVYCPNGVTEEAWARGLSNFPLANGKYITVK